MSLAAILLLYLAIGVAAAVGTVTITRRWLSPRGQHLFFAWLLVPIAAMYLAFVDFFERPGSFPLEAWAAAAALEPGSPVFRPIDQHGHIGAERLESRSVSRIVKSASLVHGLDMSTSMSPVLSSRFGRVNVGG